MPTLIAPSVNGKPVELGAEATNVAVNEPPTEGAPVKLIVLLRRVPEIPTGNT